MSYFKRHNDEKGVVLISALLFMAIITVAGTSAYFTSSNELQISTNYKRMKQSLYDAEGGIALTLAVIEKNLVDGNMELDESSESITYEGGEVPTGFNFTPVTTVTRVGGTNRYRFQVTGKAGNSGGSSTTLEVVFDRDSKLNYGLFADDTIQIGRDTSVYSFDSSVADTPTPETSTHEADIGSNKLISHLGATGENTYEVDGNIDLGNAEGDPGDEAELQDPMDELIIGGFKNDVAWVDPDPLGVEEGEGGVLDTKFTEVESINDNDDAKDVDTDDSVVNEDNELHVVDGQTVKLTEGDYYLSDIVIEDNATLEIDNSSGPVNIYLSGPLMASGANCNIEIAGSSSDFSIYSNSDDPIHFNNFSEFKGMIYAPFATINMYTRGSDVYGALWGSTIRFSYATTNNFYFDTAITQKWLVDTVSIVSWRDIRYH